MHVRSNSSCHKTSLLQNNFTGVPGSYVPIKESIKGFKLILDGHLDDLPEDAFRGVGPIEDVLKKAQEMGVTPSDPEAKALLEK